MRIVAYLFGGVTAAGAAGYFTVYLYRWEWQRALLAGVLLLVIEVFLFGAVVLGRIGTLERRLADSRDRTESVRRRLEETREPSVPRFRWLGPDGPRDGGPGPDRTYVFVPVLMVTGVLLSGVAWLVQHLAAAVRPAAERRLGGRLAPLAAPEGGIDGAGGDLEDSPAPGLGPRGRRFWVTAIAVPVAIAVLSALVAALADATETRPEPREKAQATTLLLRLSTRDATDAARADLDARRMWEFCRGAAAVPLTHAPLTRVRADLYAGTVSPALRPNDRERLRGCLVDVRVAAAHFTVVGEGQIEPLG